MPLDKPNQISNDSLSTPYITVNSDVAELGKTVATFYSGTTAQRPTVNVIVGDQFYNTQLKQLEIYTDNGWIAEGTPPQAPTFITAANSTAVAYGGTPAVTVNFIPATTGAPSATYTVTSNPATTTQVVTTSSAVIMAGLNAGTSYTFSVYGSNIYGNTSAITSTSVAAATKPQAPTMGTPTSASNTSISVPFTVGNSGGSAVTVYTVYSNPGNIVATGTSSPIIVTGLSSTTFYTFTVIATNAVGNSDLSLASVPLSPTSIITAGLLMQLDAGATASYSGGSTWTDLSGNNKNITLTNTASGGSGLSTYVTFNGSSSYGTLGSALLGNPSTTTFTAQFWVYQNSVGTTQEWISQWSSSNSGNSMFIGVRGWTNNNTHAVLYAADSTQLNPFPVPTGQWLNIAVVNDVAGNTMYYYQNGVLIGTGSGKIASTGSDVFYLGKQGSLASEYFDGRMAAVFMYNRVLSASEILQNFDTHKARYGYSTVKAVGGAIFSDATYYYHRFVNNGNFIPSSPLTVELLNIAGGASAQSDQGGGCGAGGYVYTSGLALTSGTSYPVVVGPAGINGQNGGNSSFNSQYTAIGGGLPGAYSNAGPQVGGSGGGGSGKGQGGAAGTSGQGNAGGSGGGGYGGGGGGAGAASSGANGGIGISTYSAFGLATSTGQNSGGTVYYCGGGGGSARSGSGGTGGLGGGGNGNTYTTNLANSGLSWSGGGGGGSDFNAQNTGGFGVVIIRYPK